MLGTPSQKEKPYLYEVMGIPEANRQLTALSMRKSEQPGVVLGSLELISQQEKQETRRNCGEEALR